MRASTSIILAACLCAATLAVVHHGQAEARDEIARLRATVAQLAERPPSVVHQIVAAPPADVATPPSAAGALPCTAPPAPTGAAAAPTPADAPPTDDQADAIERAHAIVRDGIDAGRLTAADGAELRQIYALAGDRPELGEIAQEIAAALNRGDLKLDVDLRTVMP